MFEVIGAFWLKSIWTQSYAFFMDYVNFGLLKKV